MSPSYIYNTDGNLDTVIFLLHIFISFQQKLFMFYDSIAEMN